jgi:hypothetical protein
MANVTGQLFTNFSAFLQFVTIAIPSVNSTLKERNADSKIFYNVSQGPWESIFYKLLRLSLDTFSGYNPSSLLTFVQFAANLHSVHY